MPAMKISLSVAQTKKMALIFFGLFFATSCACLCAQEYKAASGDTGPQAWSRRAQQTVEGYSEKALPSDRITVTVQTGKNEFLKSKPSIQEGKINTHAYVPAAAERGSGFDEIWCKLKSRDAISESAVAAPPQGEPGTCMAMNQAAVELALQSAPQHETQHAHAHEKPDMRITFLPDQQYLRGDQWVRSSVRVVQDSDSTVAVQAASLRTPAWVPWLGGNQYCKLLSPRGAAELVACLAGKCDPALVKAGEPYVIGEADGGLYTEGSRFTVTVEEDAVDIYLPNAGVDKPLAAAIYMQGAKCDKRFYSAFAKLIASYGFIVAIANHNSMLGKNFTDQNVVNRVWEYLKSESRIPLSPLFRRLDTSRFALMGHSFGGVVCLNCMQSTCSLPTCIGFSYEAPKELAAVVLYGTNTKKPLGGSFMEVATRGIPVLYINGDHDGKALLADTRTTFLDKTSGGPKAFAIVRGANHYGVTDMNNPPGSNSDPGAPTLDQKQALISTARVSGIFMLAHVYNDAAASAYIYAGEGRADSSVTLETH
jgi:hypothetical protein